MIQTNHHVSLLEREHHRDGNMVTFVEDATSSYNHKETAIVTQGLEKNFTALETYKLKGNSDKTHLLVMAQSTGMRWRSGALHHSR